MRLFFVDESGRADQGGVFALGGIAVREGDWRTIRDSWHATLRAHRWPLDREVKWHGIRSDEVPDALADAVYRMLAAAPIACFVTILDVTSGPREFPPAEHAYFRSPEDVYATGLMFLAERFEHLLEREHELGIIVVDSRYREDDARLRRFFEGLQADGTPYMQLGQMVEGLFLGPSRYSIGLQCADLVVAATAAAERGVGVGRGYLRLLEPRFARHPVSGELEGVGLKRFP